MAGTAGRIHFPLAGWVKTELLQKITGEAASQKKSKNGCSEQAALRRATNLLPGQDNILTPPVRSALTMNSNTGKGGLHRL